MHCGGYYITLINIIVVKKSPNVRNAPNTPSVFMKRENFLNPMQLFMGFTNDEATQINSACIL